ncbi:hypothetical protein PCASD_24048 [Puccinia coronata f. sp. avenae]|uniref:Uncharacterized protein n=1 Tax=Puccinia coronata f. sp. avenae TaxID=200324 RepID=A0A2N5TRR6_9BASI|nr:hypothetical protein PCASD_24048 [Puccinia coronata f. sp. avenae]
MAPPNVSVEGGTLRRFITNKDQEKLFGGEGSGWKLRASKGNEPGTILITCNSPNPQVYIAKDSHQPRWLHMKIQGPKMHLITASKISIWHMGDEEINTALK